MSYARSSKCGKEAIDLRENFIWRAPVGSTDASGKQLRGSMPSVLLTLRILYAAHDFVTGSLTTL
jgi:hypothetical protein